MSAPFVFKGGSFPGGTPGSPAPNHSGLLYCSSTLNVNAGCAVTITFTPLDDKIITGAINIAYNNGAATIVSRAVQGVGTPNALLGITPLNNGGPSSFYNFGYADSHPTTQTQAFLVTNAGAASATSINAPALTNSFSYDTTGVYPGGSGSYMDRFGNSYPYCGTSIIAGSNCAIVVDFTPTGSTTSATNITLTYADGSISPATSTFGITGTGTNQAIISLSCLNCNSGGDGSTPTYDYGYVAANLTKDEYYLVSNLSQSTSSILTPIALNAQFSYPSSAFPGGAPGTSAILQNGTNYNFCPASGGTLNPNTACAILVRYTAPNINISNSSPSHLT